MSSKKTYAQQAIDLETFAWPEFTSDSKRIKAYSQRYKNLSIVEAFESCYNMQVGPVKEMVNYIPRELQVGEIIKTRILSIGKGTVTFDSANYKTSLQSAVNLHKYEKFKHFLPMDELDCVVTRVDKEKAVLDPIAPMVESWMKPILTDPTIQKVIPTGEAKIGTTIIVKDLQLTKGGFMGKAVVPTASEFVGEDYTIDAFIPGSQIVLNITDNFEQFNGKAVEAFVVNYIPKPGTKSGMSLICSRKEVIKFAGECNMIQIFNSWCDETELWKKVSNTAYDGKVTGVINTSKKCGVFVEIPELSITGMVTTKPEELVNYKPHSDVKVKLTGFDEEMFYNQDVGQRQHVLPYEIENGVLKKCNLKPILQFA